MGDTLDVVVLLALAVGALVCSGVVALAIVDLVHDPDDEDGGGSP